MLLALLATPSPPAWVARSSFIQSEDICQTRLSAGSWGCSDKGACCALPLLGDRLTGGDRAGIRAGIHMGPLLWAASAGKPGLSTGPDLEKLNVACFSPWEGERQQKLFQMR